MVPDYDQCLVQWMGNWDANTKYENTQILTQPGVYFTLVVVSYANTAYVMNNSSLPIKGTIPPEDTAWTVWTAGGSSSDHYKGTYDASTNTPTLTNGVGTAGDFYLVTTGGTDNPTGENIPAGNIIIYTGAVWEDGGAANNTDQIAVSTNYVSIPGQMIAIGQTLTYALGALQGQSTLAATNITTLQGNITTINGEITTIQGDITTLDTEVATNTTNIALLNANKQNLILTPTAGHIATTDSLGQTEDSGVSIATTVTNTDSTIPTSKAVETYIGGALPTLPLAIAQGGTGQTTQQSAIDALTGAQSSGKYLRSDGTHSTLSTIQALDVPTLNQNTTGNAATATNIQGGAANQAVIQTAPNTTSFKTYSSDVTASALVATDANSNFAVNAVIENADYNTINNVVTLDVTSAPIQIYNGNNIQPDYVLPQANTLRTNATFEFINQSIGNQTTDTTGILNFLGASIVSFMFPNYKAVCKLADNTSDTSWTVQIIPLMAAADSGGAAIYPRGNGGANILATDPTTSTVETPLQTILNNLNTVIGGDAGVTIYNNTAPYTVGEFVAYNGSIWECIVLIPSPGGQIPSITSAYWSMASSTIFTKYANVAILTGNDTAAAASGSYSFKTCQAALNYVGSNGAVFITDYRKTYNEDITIAGMNQVLIANAATFEAGAFQKSLTLASGSGFFSSANIQYTNNVDAPALTIANGSSGYCCFKNSTFSISASSPASAAILFAGTWAGDYYFDNGNIQGQPITIGGTPSLPYNIYIYNFTGQGNVLNINVNANVVVHIYNCQQVNILSQTAGTIYMDGVLYLSALPVTAAAASGLALNIRNTSMKNPITGTYAIPTGTGTIACNFLNFDYPRGSYAFAGTVVDLDNGFNAINRLAYIPGKPYNNGDTVTVYTAPWAAFWTCTAPVSTTDAPSVSSNNWVQTSNYYSTKSVYVDATNGNNNKYNTNVFTTATAALNFVGYGGAVRAVTINNMLTENITQPYSNQLFTGLTGLNSAQQTIVNGTLTLPSGVSNWESSNVNYFSVASNAALVISSGNGGGNNFVACNFGNSTAGDNAVLLSTGWTGLNNFNSCAFNQTNSVIVQNGANTDEIVVFSNTVGQLNIQVQTNCTVRIIGTSGGNPFFNISSYYTVGSGAHVYTSSNASTWTAQSSIPTANNLRGINLNSTLGLIVIVGEVGTILTSPDGVTYTTQTSGTTYNLLGIANNSSGLNVAVGNNGTNPIILSSPDGVTWTSRTSPVTNILNAVAYSSSLNLFVAVGANGALITSPDGVTWTNHSILSTVSLSGVAFANTIFLALGSGSGAGSIYTSPDGITWTSQTSGTTHNLLGATYLGSTYIVVGTSGTILTSTNGTTWTTQTSGTTNNLEAINTYNGLAIAVGLTGTIVTSPDGTTWTTQTLGATTGLFGVIYISNNTSPVVNVLSYTGGKLLIEDCYINSLNVSANAGANNSLAIRNCTMQNPFTGAYSVPIGTGTVATELLDFNYNRGAYTFAGLVADTLAGIPVSTIGTASEVATTLITNNSPHAILMTVTPTTSTAQPVQVASNINYNPTSGVLTTPAVNFGEANLDYYQEGTFTVTPMNLTVAGTPRYVGTFRQVGKILFLNLYINSSISTSATTSTYFLTTGIPNPTYSASGTYSNSADATNSGVATYNTSSEIHVGNWTASSDINITIPVIMGS